MSFDIPIEDDFGSLARNSHTNLLAHTFLVTFKNVIIWEGLQSCTFTVSQSTRLTPVIDVSSAAAAPCYGVGRLFRIEPLVYLADFCALNMEHKFLRQVSSKCILTGFDVLESLHYSS